VAGDAFEHMFRYSARVQRSLVERWWNGNFGRLARRDVWLWQLDNGTWLVEICQGGMDGGRRAEWPYTDEAEARRMLDRCVETGGAGWRQLPSN
jgi:hypothetical protein